MLGPERLSEYARILTSAEAPDRHRSLEELEDLSCDEEVSGSEKKAIAATLLAGYHLRTPSERRLIARFLEIWFHTEYSRRLSRIIELARMEEVDEDARESLKAAAITLMPARDLVRFLADPPAEDLDGGLGLLMALETAYTRLKTGAFRHSSIGDLVEALRKARGHRAAHIARPFLWRLEFVLETAEKIGRFLPSAE